MHYERSCISKRLDVADLLRRITIWLLTEWILSDQLILPDGMTLATLPFEWVPRGMPWWKPSEEIKGDIDAIGAGFTCPQDVVRKRGQGDFHDNVDKIREAREYAESQGVQLSWAASADAAKSGSPVGGKELSDRLAAIEEAMQELHEQGILDG